MIKKVSDSYKKHLVPIILGPTLKMIEAFFDLCIPLVMKAVIDLTQFSSLEAIPESNKLSRIFGVLIRSFGCWVQGNQPLSDALVGFVLIISMGIVGFGLTMIAQYLAARSAISVGAEIKQALFEKALSLSKKDREKFGKNKISTILNSDVYQVQQGVFHFTRLIVRMPFIIIGALIFSFMLNIKIGIVFAAIIPLILIIVFFIMTKSSKRYLSIQSKLDDLSTKTDDTVEGLKVIRAFNKEDYENNSFKEKTQNYKKSSLGVIKLNSFINPLTFAIISAATLCVVIFGGKPILDNIGSEGVLLATTIITEISYLAQVMFALTQFTMVVNILVKGRVSEKRCNELFFVKPSVISKENATIKEINLKDQILSFNNVSYKYGEEGNAALSNISFELLKGESLGIIGGTGSGKSTLISLIERFSDASDGTILYKSENIKNYDLSKLRNDIGLVMQKSTLFKGTIKSNMLLSNSSSTDEEIIEALKVSNAFEFVCKYNDGLEHVVEESGSNFSGGQRQRLCIARALLKNPEILILDDSTSALDLLTDKLVRTNISTKYKGITKIIISQRVSTIADCDKILVLDSGKLIALGSHKELLEKCDIYKETYSSQARLEND